MFPRHGFRGIIDRVKRIIFYVNNAEVVLNSLTMIDLCASKHSVLMALLLRPGRPTFSPYRPSKRRMFIIWLTFLNLKDATSKLYWNYKYTARAVFRSKRIQRIPCYTPQFNQFKKFEWNKLVRAEIKARKYVLGQRTKSLGNSREENWILFARINLTFNVQINEDAAYKMNESGRTLTNN